MPYLKNRRYQSDVLDPDADGALDARRSVPLVRCVQTGADAQHL